MRKLFNSNSQFPSWKQGGIYDYFRVFGLRVVTKALSGEFVARFYLIYSIFIAFICFEFETFAHIPYNNQP